MTLLTDRYGRSFPYLRLSLLDGCNFRCSYCLPDGYRSSRRPHWLTLDEIRRLLSAFAAVGVHKLRLTGGEPSLRADLPAILSTASTTPGLRRIALTTNGILVRRRLPLWQANGLSALNVSLDSLDRNCFRAITGHDRFDEVLEGIELTLQSGLDAVKLNSVMLRGLNDDQWPSWLEYLRHRDLSVRFIELMQTGENADYFRHHHLRSDALERMLTDTGWSELPKRHDAGPAREFSHPDFAGRIGIIAPYSRDFCAGCNRLRVTSTGDLRLCLFGESGLPLRPLLQHDAQHDELVATLRRHLAFKRIGHALADGETGLAGNLAMTGG